MKIAFHTLGCKNNQLETSAIADEFTANGWEVVDFESIADFYVINTCTVTSKSDTHSRATARKAHKINHDARIIVTGCYAQTAPAEVEKIEGVWLVAGNKEKMSLYDIVIAHIKDETRFTQVSNILKVKDFEDKKVQSASGRTRINVKIQDGCNYRCSYCIVPYARGPSRSNLPDRVIEQISEVAHNYPEVVLTAIHLGQFGLDLNPKTNLAGLLRRIVAIPHLQRLRLSSIDPLEINDDLIKVLAESPKICRHLHISLQTASDKILKAMHRRYTVDDYRKIIDKLANSIDGLAIGSDIIVGFPGETDNDFDITVKNLESLPLSYLHVFSYSVRKGTEAANMPDQLSPEVKKYRNKVLKQLSDSKNLLFRKSFEGKILEIIPENARDKKTGRLKGLSDNYISVLASGDDEYKGKIIPVKINRAAVSITEGEIAL